MAKFKVRFPDDIKGLLDTIGVEEEDRGPVFEGLVDEEELKMMKMQIENEPRIAEIEEFGNDPNGSGKVMVRVEVFTEDPSIFWRNLLLRRATNMYG